MWICRERRREKEKKTLKQTGRLENWSRPIQTDAWTDRETEQLVDWLPWLEADGGRASGGAEVGGSEMGLAAVSLNAFACVVRAGPWPHHFRVVCPTDEQRDRQTDSLEMVGFWGRGGRRLQDSGQLKKSRKSACAFVVCVCVNASWHRGGRAVNFQLHPFRRPYLRHLWLQHQRLWAHPRNVYVDLTVTWGKEEQLNTQTHMGPHMYAHTHSVHWKMSVKQFSNCSCFTSSTKKVPLPSSGGGGCGGSGGRWRGSVI